MSEAIVSFFKDLGGPSGAKPDPLTVERLLPEYILNTSRTGLEVQRFLLLFSFSNFLAWAGLEEISWLFFHARKIAVVYISMLSHRTLTPSHSHSRYEA